MESLTQLIHQVGTGDRQARDALFNAAYTELRQLAAAQRRPPHHIRHRVRFGAHRQSGLGPAATLREEEEQSFDRSQTMFAAAGGRRPELD